MKQSLLILTILLMMSASSCAKKDEKGTSSPTSSANAAPASTENKQSVKSASAAVSGVSITYLSAAGPMTLQHEKGQMPADYPKDIPVYPGAGVNGAGSSEQGLAISFADINQPVREKTGEFLLLETTDPVEQILDFYRRELEKEGWKTQPEGVTDARLNGLAAIKGSRRIRLLIKKSSGKQDIMQVSSPLRKH